MTTPRNHAFPRGGRFFRALALFSSLTVASVFSSQAAQLAAGTVTGTVSNAATAAYLEGAQVTLQPGSVQVLTSRDGRFEVPNLAPGQYTLTVTYSGLDPKTVVAQVEAGRVASYEIGLSSEIYQLSQFVVEGEREGNALAITQQRNAPNVKNVVSSDAFGNIADLNLGNFLLRMPGVSKEESEGEVIRVQVRGVSADLSAVSIDGTRAANGTTRDFNRGFEIDKVPTDFIETIEITKAPTAEMDADSIGGNVNLRTKSALDRKGRRITYQVGNSYNMDQKTFRPLGSFSYSDILIDQKLGVLFTASYNEAHKPRDRSNVDWERTTDTNRPAYFGATSWGEDRLKHKRQGVGLRFDYRISPTTKVYFNTMSSVYEDQLKRYQGGLPAPTASTVLPGWTDKVTVTRNQTYTTNQNFRERDVKTWNFQVGGDSNVWGGKLDFTANYSPSKGTQERFIPTRNIAGVGFRQEFTVTHNWVKLTQVSGPDIFDPNNSTAALDWRVDSGRDQIAGGQLNFRRPLATTIPMSFKTGARYRWQQREQNQNRRQYTFLGANGVAGPVGAANDDNLGSFIDTAYNYRTFEYPMVPYMKLTEFRAMWEAHPEYFNDDAAVTTRESLRYDNTAQEKVAAAYLMGDARFGRLTVLAGVRMEDTRFTGEAFRQEISPAEKARRAAWTGPVTRDEAIRRTLAEWNNPVSSSGKYRDYFPSVHFKYDIARGLVGRASFSTGIGRPNFGQIVPTMNVDNDRLTITSNNPDLKPQYSKNYDATLEYYFEPAGMLSGGVFQKNLSDFIYRANVGTIEPGSMFGDVYTGYSLTTDRNGGSAEIRGLELSYSQQYTFLPGIWRGLGAFANFTYLKTEGDYGTPGATMGKHELPNFTPKVGNVGLTYIAHGLTVRVKLNYTGRRLQSYYADWSRRQYNTVSKPVDVNLAYQIHRHMSLYADFINVFNTPTNHEYTYIPDRKSRSDLYTTIVKFGVSGSF